MIARRHEKPEYGGEEHHWRKRDDPLVGSRAFVCYKDAGTDSRLAEHRHKHDD